MIVNSKDSSKDMGMADSMDTGKDNSKVLDLMLPLVLILLGMVIQIRIQTCDDQNRSLVDQNQSQISYHFDSCAFFFSSSFYTSHTKEYAHQKLVSWVNVPESVNLYRHLHRKNSLRSEFSIYSSLF